METIDDFLNKFKTLKDRDEILSMGDIVDIFETGLFKDHRIHCFCKGNKKDYIPTLSFSWEEKKVGGDYKFTVYKRKKQIISDNKRIQRKKQSSKVSILENSKFKLIISNLDPSVGIHFDKLLKCCEIVRDSSLNIRNYSRDKLVVNLQVLKEKISSSPNFNSSDLSNFIADLFKIKKIIFKILPDETTKLLYNKKRIFLQDLLENEYKKYLFESKNTGKPITWKCHEINQTFYHCLIPLIEKSEKPLFIDEFILLWGDKRFTIDIINNIVELIDAFRTLKFIRTKLFSLLNLQNEVMENIQKSYFEDRRKQEDNFEQFATKCLNHIVNSTYSHSATVRVYNPYNKSLKLFKDLKTDWGNRVSELNEVDYKEIPIRKFRVSLNAFTFLRNSNIDSYSYIKNTNKKIPDEYRVKGLREILKHRDSLSEICFPLFCGKIPFGTINMESTIKNAFDHDIKYLFGIKKALETFYDISIKSSDAKWLAGRSPVYRNVHELSQHLRLNRESFSTKQIGLLKRLILLDDTITPSELINVSKLYDELIKWLRTQINSFAMETAQNHIIFDLKNDHYIKFDVFENILLICKNLVNNIIAHSDFRRDKIIIMQNDHLRMGVNANLKIFVKTFGSFEDQSYNSLLISPIIKNNEYHYGMFLVGMLARKLGGIALISRGNSYSPHTIIEVSIPLKSREV